MSEDIELKKKEIKAEIDRLQYEFKVELPKKIAEARAYGDLKENAEYHAARERQSFVKARIAQLNDQLIKLSDLDVGSIPDDRIGYGSVVTVYDVIEEEERELTLVTASEANPSSGKISMASPIGAALLNKKAGEEVQFTIPAGTKKLKIMKIVTLHGDELVAEGK